MLQGEIAEENPYMFVGYEMAEGYRLKSSLHSWSGFFLLSICFVTQENLICLNAFVSYICSTILSTFENTVYYIFINF